MKNKWTTAGDNFYLREVSQQLTSLPVAVYRVNENPLTDELSLIKVQDTFEFAYKVYGTEERFISRVVKTYNSTISNLGILLNGVKGTGKTVTARQICNALKLPVIVVPSAFKNMSAFVQEIQQDVVILIDEFEKIYSDYDSQELLAVMDGIMNSQYRRVFLLTTNKLSINDNLLERPGRIRYVKTFKDLALDTIIEVVDDILVRKDLRQEVIEYISSLESITIDIVKSIVQEVNIHNEPPSVFADVFNTKQNGNKYDVYEISYGKEPTLVYSEGLCKPSPVTEKHLYRDFEVNSLGIGEIVKVHADNTFTVSVYDGEEDAKKVLKTFQLVQVKTLHREFWTHAF